MKYIMHTCTRSCSGLGSVWAARPGLEFLLFPAWGTGTNLGKQWVFFMVNDGD